ncbi:annulin [Thrips palmi]|uniref:protein-glutamine gamma-glutamyltransferase n=1 Tax=Thrips palmi TaxID=161013 RepID=A0A6P8XUW0_THRPL|nr:annulin [Thrips palmi]
MVCEDCGMFGNLLERVRALFRHGGAGPPHGRHFYPADVLPKPPRYPYGTRGRGRAFNDLDGELVDPRAGSALSVVAVVSVDLCLAENGAIHNTARFELMERPRDARLVVRRGQAFALALGLSRPFQRHRDAVSFIFSVADSDKNSFGQGTLVAVPLLEKIADSPAEWSAVLDATEGNYIRVLITPAVTCIVGEWKMEVDTKLQGDGALSYSLPGGIFILFNPWCPEDQVYLYGEDLRQEYVLNDSGLIYRGSYNRIRPSVWKFAQFERDVLECTLYLAASVGRLSPPSRADPVKTARALSAAVNSPDDNGAVMGNWTSEFEGGTPPTKWVGSMKILQTFHKTHKPVKYGQCWVFSGVLGTLCRALGIPCRVITCYASAHDTQNSLTVDYFVNDAGKVMEELNSDSIWNFHVWNEVWMQRPDLEPAPQYAGWQVIDSTPQELSDDMYRCGPASVAAVKRGEVLRPYDANFVYAEVNADKVFWKYAGPTQPLKLLRKDTLGIGLLISTKAVGKWTREDVTHTYKYPEKSDEERSTMLKALAQSESLFSRYYLNEDFNDLQFDFQLRDDIVIGQPFSVVVLMRNRSRREDYSVTVVLRVDTVLYTGRVKEPVKKERSAHKVRAGTEEEVRLDVSWEEYAPRLLDQAAFNIACLATVHETDYEYFAQDDFRVRKPDIKIQLESPPVTDRELMASASLVNPLPIALKRGQFIIEGPGVDKQLKIDMAQAIPPNGTATVSFRMVPRVPGKATIAAKFVSKQLDDVDGFLEFMVSLNPDTLA